MAELHYHNHFCPPNDVVFAVMFVDRDLFRRLISSVTGSEVDIKGKVYSQATLRENDPLLNSIRFDTFTETHNDQYYTADIQRSYEESRLKRRTIFYTCRAISTQDVNEMAYEDLKPVNVSFVLTTHEVPHAIQRV